MTEGRSIETEKLDDEGRFSLRNFFQSVVSHSRSILDGLPIPAKIQPLSQTFASLTPAIEMARGPAVAALRELQRPAPVRVVGEQRPAAMNTVGILSDRLTILICKEWYLRNRMRQPEKADEVCRQTDEIIEAFCFVTRGNATLLEKVSLLPADAIASRFEEAYYGMLEANLLMWEAQEILYMSKIDTLPLSELQDYIRFFSIANMKRNAYITLCEGLYWADGSQNAPGGTQLENEACVSS